MESLALQVWVPVLVALATGTAIPKLIDVWSEARKARRSEMSLEEKLERAEHRARIAIEWGHKNAVLAIRYGATEAELPRLDFRDNEGG